MICFASCVGSKERFQRYAVAGVRRVAEEDSQFIECSSESSIFEAYNEVLDYARERDDLEALVLLHDDTEIVDERFLDKIRGRLNEPGVGVIGVIGGRDLETLSWWDHRPAGRVLDGRGLIEFEERAAEVDAVDGLLMVLSPQAVRELRFDADTFTGFHGYDADICFQARSAGLRVLVDELEVVHHAEGGGYRDTESFQRADRLFRQKWLPGSDAVAADGAAGPEGATGAAGVRADRLDKLGRYYEWDRPELRALVPRDARRVLDVGCATGALGASIKAELGAWVAGVELFPQAAEIAATRLDELIVADLDTVEELPGDLDVAVFGDVLEHLRDPARLLSVVRRHLRPDGAIVCSVPNVKHWTVLAPLLIQDRWHYEDQGLLDRTHIHFFTLQEFDTMLGEAGFVPERVGCHEVALPADLEPLVDVAVRFGADRDETRARLSAYQYLVVARRGD